MARNVERLKALQVKQRKKPGWLPDGAGLYLQVSGSGSKSWVYRYETAGKERRCGLGAYPSVSLEAAREAAHECRRLRRAGIDPIDQKRLIAAEKRLAEGKAITFKECALAYIDLQNSGWKNSKHESQWRNTLETYAYPIIGELPIKEVNIGHILKIVEPIWLQKTETASRVRQRIENILDWAKVLEYRLGENPARWRGHLDKVLPQRNKVQKVKHFNAMPYTDVPTFFKILRATDTLSAKALAFTILTATRNGEARGILWEEIDLKMKVWNIPAERMKAGRKHRIPLSGEAVKILEEAKQYRNGKHIFPGLKKNKAISEAALMKLLKQQHPTLTIHGFRSTFRDWCAEMTNYPREVAEAALAHVIKDKTEAAYLRGDIFLKRIKLMSAWAAYCTADNHASNVVPLKKEKAQLILPSPAK